MENRLLVKKATLLRRPRFLVRPTARSTYKLRASAHSISKSQTSRSHKNRYSGADGCVGTPKQGSVSAFGGLREWHRPYPRSVSKGPQPGSESECSRGERRCYCVPHPLSPACNEKLHPNHPVEASPCGLAFGAYCDTAAAACQRDSLSLSFDVSTANGRAMRVAGKSKSLIEQPL